MRHTGFKQAAQRFWNRYIATEDPDAGKERIRRQQIEDLKVGVDLMEAMRLWEKGRSLRLREPECV